MSKYKVLKDNIKNVVAQEFERTIPIITEEYEAKIRRQAAEITRLLAENKKLKETKTEDIEHWCDVCTKQSVIEQARTDGADAAWELARKLENLDLGSLLEIFKECNCYKKIYNYTYQETAKKVAEWEKTKAKIKVGDVLEDIYDSNVKCTVTNLYTNNMAYLVFDDGTAGMHKLDNFKKTGRRTPIDSFLKQIRGKQE